MTRQELFKQHYPEGEDCAPLFDQEYAVLKEMWDSVPSEYRDSMPDLPVPLPEGCKPGALAVEQRYRYRMASIFASDMPLIFRRMMMLADNKEAMDLLFFGTMGVLSACLPGVSGSLRREVVNPNLFIFVTGSAASGKGQVNLCRKLLDPLCLYYGLKKQSLYVLPADSSATALYEEINGNDGRGILFETELDTLSHTLLKPYGQFGDGLRRAFHGEPISYMRRTANERVVIPNPVVSMVLTGTPGQVPTMFKLNNAENGLFSRVLFYRLTTEEESFLEDPEIHRGITGQMVNEYVKALGNQVFRFYLCLQRKPGGVQFRLTDEQHQQFLSYFHDATEEYKELFRQGYGEEAAGHAVSTMRRLGNICYRMMMVLSVSRLMEDIEADRKFQLPDVVECDPRDFERILAMEPMLRFNNHLQYDELMVANGVVPTLQDEDGNEGDMLKPAQRLLFQSLPDKFITQQALQVSENLSLTERTIKNYLARFCDLGLLIKRKRGSYEKSSNGVIDAEEVPKA